jgi:hypothetical protein
MQIRLLHRSDLQIANDLLHQLGYDISSAELADWIDRVLATRTHYAAVADDGRKVVGLIHAYERPTLEKPHEVIVQSLVVDVSAPKLGTGRLFDGTRAHRHDLSACVMRYASIPSREPKPPQPSKPEPDMLPTTGRRLLQTTPLGSLPTCAYAR